VKAAAGEATAGPRRRTNVIDGNRKPGEDVVGVEPSAAEPGPLEEDGASDVNAGSEDEISELKAALAEAEQELARHRDAMLRIQAEAENVRKRMARDLDKSRRFALEGVMKDLLQVRDSLERGLSMSGEAVSVASLREGQELTLKMLGKVLEDHGLVEIDPAGQPFDPEFHEAMTVIPSPDVDENTVIEVLQKGYRLHDRLIRPARVVVSRKP
jgi:molecular chaperone GrpE